jgi:hypothetical protein
MAGEETAAERELRDAIALLDRGRAGASESWIETAEHYVEQCRARVLNERLRSRYPEAWSNGDPSGAQRH